ncbi:hypothetical protein GQ44DRAFT_723597 [Phaeosphaeriaceae sp. PMI808]|nr:hypothetical protein GQ44DRAFT_723597 [Phaeosphaeriaceae sp. PMI808]
MCGDFSIESNRLVDFSQLMSCDHFILRDVNRKRIPYYRNQQSIYLLDIQSTNRPGYMSIGETLFMSLDALAADCRDIVYAILGLVSRGHGQHIVLDYTLSPCKVYRLAMEAILEDSKAIHGRPLINNKKCRISLAF